MSDIPYQPDAEQRLLQDFVTRARRVEEHSLLVDRSRLKDLAEKNVLRFDVNIAGRATLKRALPPEEQFESLAARVRPLILDEELVFGPKVMNALKTVVKFRNPDHFDAVAPRADGLKREWNQFKVDRELKPTNVSAADAGSMPLGMKRISEGQMALAWMNGDLVHASPEGSGLLAAMELPAIERFICGAAFFSRAALLTTETLDWLRELRERGVIHLDESSFTAPVTVRDDELLTEVDLRTAPIGTVLPTDLAALDEEVWRKVTPQTLLGRQPDRQMQIRLLDGGETVAEFDGVVMDRELDEAEGSLAILVADSTLLRLASAIEGGEIGVPEVSIESLSLDNLMMLRALRFRQALAHSDVVEISGYHGPLVKYGISTSMGATDLTELGALVDLLEDLVELQAVRGDEFPVFEGEVRPQDAWKVRVIRLVAQGKVVAGPRSPQVVYADNPPDVVKVSPSTVTVGNVIVKGEEFLMTAPDMRTRRVNAEQDGESQYEISPADGERFLMWSEKYASVRADFMGAAVSPWGLSWTDETAQDV